MSSFLTKMQKVLDISSKVWYNRIRWARKLALLWPKQTKAEVLAYSIAHQKEEMLRGAKHRAKRKGLPFNLDISDIEIPSECPFLKTPFIRGTMYATSLDRVIPELGYVKGNVGVMSRKANVMKNDATTKELLEFAYSILERN